MIAELEAVELDDNLVFIRRVLNKSRVRKDILRLLFKVHPDMSYPAEIARAITTTPANVLEALRGVSRYEKSYSLTSLGLVDVETIDGRKYYKLSEKGLALVDKLGY